MNPNYFRVLHMLNYLAYMKAYEADRATSLYRQHDMWLHKLVAVLRVEPVCSYVRPSATADRPANEELELRQKPITVLALAMCVAMVSRKNVRKFGTVSDS